jgi:hypothetical protein
MVAIACIGSAVEAPFPFATTADRKEPDNSIPGETYYYVSASE